MSDYFFLPEFDIKDSIISISPNCGCASSCIYCYIGLKKFTKPMINECSIEETIQYIQNHPKYLHGSKGSVFWVGTWGEIFPKNKKLRDNGFCWIQNLLSTGNPVVILTKSYLTTEEIKKLYTWQKYSGQLFLSESICTLKNWKTFEPYADEPQNRIKTLAEAAKHNLRCGVFISPYLKGITDTELTILFQQLKQVNVKNIAVQALYMNDDLEKKMKNNTKLSEIIDRYKEREKLGIQEMKTEEYSVVADDLEDREHFILENSKKYGLNIYFHFKCMIANAFQIKTNEISKIPLFCKNCDFCKKL